MGARGGDGVLLAAVGRRGRAGRSAPVVVRRAAGARRGGAGRRATGGRVQSPTRSRPTSTRRRRTPSSKGCGWPVALTLDVDPAWRSGYYEVVMEIDVGEKVRRDHAFFVVRPSSGAAHRARAGDQHLARLQRLRRTEPLHRRHPRRHAAADGGGLPVQAAGQGPPGDGDGRARSAERRPRRLPPAQPPVGLRRVGGLARLGAAVHRVGRARGLRDRRVHERRPRGPPRGAGRREPVPVGRPRRVLVARHARHGRGVHRPRRQRRVLLGQHVVVAGAHRGRRPRRDGRVQGLLQERPADGHRPRAGGDDVLVRRGRRPAREPHDRRHRSPAAATTASAAT